MVYEDPFPSPWFYDWGVKDFLVVKEKFDESFFNVD